MKYPNGELVGQAWTAGHAGIPAGQIASTLPAPNKWTAVDKGVAFLQVRALAGSGVDSDLPHRRVSVLQFDAWGARTVNDAFRPLWGITADLLERVRVATFPDAQLYGRPVTMPLDGYLPARVLSVFLLGEPTRIEGDPSGYARMTCPVSLAWTV